jgi:hypothetical protein
MALLLLSCVSVDQFPNPAVAIVPQVWRLEEYPYLQTVCTNTSGKLGDCLLACNKDLINITIG